MKMDILSCSNHSQAAIICSSLEALITQRPAAASCIMCNLEAGGVCRSSSDLQRALPNTLEIFQKMTDVQARSMAQSGAL